MKRFLRPTLAKLAIFAGLFLILLWILTNHTLRVDFFPCQTQPVVPHPPEYRADWCGLYHFSPGLVGLNVRLTIPGLIVIVLVVIVFPYLLSCLIGHRIGKKSRPS